MAPRSPVPVTDDTPPLPSTRTWAIEKAICLTPMAGKNDPASIAADVIAIARAIHDYTFGDPTQAAATPTPETAPPAAFATETVAGEVFKQAREKADNRKVIQRKKRATVGGDSADDKTGRRAGRPRKV